MELICYTALTFACIWVVFKIWDICQQHGNGLIDFIFSMIALISLPFLALGSVYLTTSLAVYTNTWAYFEFQNYLNQDVIWAEWLVMTVSGFAGVLGLLIGLTLTVFFLLQLGENSDKVSKYYYYRGLVFKDRERKERERQARMMQLDNN